MTEHAHAVVWLDHHEAKIFHFNADSAEEKLIIPADPHVHLHHKANSIGSGHAAEDKAYLHAIVDAIRHTKAVLITGPGLAKTALVKHIASHDPGIMSQVSGIETVDHPSDGALVAHARAYFRKADHTTAQKN
jgi:stalled ribosome rescue protein Dom34